MFLRNKHTGEIIEWEKNITYKVGKTYRSLKELQKDWEDVRIWEEGKDKKVNELEREVIDLRGRVALLETRFQGGWQPYYTSYSKEEKPCEN